jgi:hypothetical protein
MTFGTQSGGEWPPAPPTCPILSGATKGSPTITVDSTSATSGHIVFTVGNFIQIQATANPPFVHNMGVASYDTNLAMTFRVTGLTSNTVTFTPAIPMDFSSYSPSVAIFSTTPKHGIGLENFTIDLQNTGTMGINFGPLWGSWVTNVEIKNSYNHILALWEVNQSEISHNYFHDNTRQGPNTEGLDFLRASDWNLITDNIVWNGGGIVIGDWNGGIVGNVIAYNYAYNQKTSNSDVAASDIDLNHGSNNFLNLIEGNIVGGITSDGYYGSNSHYTIFRNWATITNPTATNNLYGLRLKHFSDYFNVVGNVFGTSAFPTNGTISNGVGYGGFYETPQISGVDDGCSFGMTSIYELGFPGSDCNTWYTGTIGPSTPIDYSAAGVNNALDLNVAATLIRHGNYDYYSRNTIWDPNISDHNIPTSLYLTSKPSFFGNLPWPPIGPDLNPMTGAIPAKARYDGQSYPYGPTDTTPPAAPSGLSVN